MFALVICCCFRCKLLYQSACRRIELFFFNSVNLNPMYAARYWNKRGLFLLGSLLWEEVSHPNAQRLFLLWIFFFKAISIFFPGMCPLIHMYKQIKEICSRISDFCFSCFLPQPSKKSHGCARLPSGLLLGIFSVPIWCSIVAATGFTYALCSVFTSCLAELWAEVLF